MAAPDSTQAIASAGAAGASLGLCAGSTAAPRRSLRAFALGFLFVLCVRAGMALSRFDEFRGEELYIGSFGWALRAGLPLDPANLPIIVHLRGSVIFGGLAALLSFALGPTMLCLKTLAVLWSAATGGLLAVLCTAAANARTAAAAVLLFAFLPPSYQMVDVLALGSHADVPLCLFAALAVLLWRPGPLGVGRAALFGLCLGFGSLFSLHFVVALPVFLIAWWRVDPRFWRRASTALAALCAALAAAPIPLLSRSTTLVQKSVGDHILPDGLAAAFAKLGRTLGGEFFEAWLYRENGGAAWAWVFGAGLALGLILLAPRLRRAEPLALFAVLYPLTVLAAHATSDFELNLVITKNGMGSRYFMPVMPFLTLWCALAVGRRGWRDALALCACLAPLAAGLAGYAALFQPARAFEAPRVHGSLFPFFAHLASGAGRKFPARLAWSRRLDPDWEATRALRYNGLHPRSAFLAQVVLPGDFAAAYASGRALDPTEARFVDAELGLYLGERNDPALAADVLAELGGQASAHFVRSIGRGILRQGLAELVRTEGERTGGFARLRALAQRASAAQVERVAEGAGFQLGFLFTPYNDNHGDWIVRAESELPSELLLPFCRGLAIGWRARFFETGYWVPEPGAVQIEGFVPEPARAEFRRALELAPAAFGEP